MIEVAKGEGLFETAKLVSAVRGYQLEKTRRKDGIVDFTASSLDSNERILIRVIAQHDGKAGFIGINAVKDMSQTLQNRCYSKGILIGKRFTEAARNEMTREEIETVRAGVPRFKREELYLVIQDHVDILCHAKCGQPPNKESDCQGHLNGDHTCQVRKLSDDASFHFDRGWVSLLERDLIKLLTIEEDLKDSNLAD